MTDFFVCAAILYAIHIERISHEQMLDEMAIAVDGSTEDDTFTDDIEGMSNT